MTAPLTIFGKPFTVPCKIQYGCLFLVATEHAKGIWVRIVNGGPFALSHDVVADADAARDWLEAEARRIAREMLVMAGPIRYRWTEDEQGAAVTEFLP